MGGLKGGGVGGGEREGGGGRRLATLWCTSAFRCVLFGARERAGVCVLYSKRGGACVCVCVCVRERERITKNENKLGE